MDWDWEQIRFKLAPWGLAVAVIGVLAAFIAIAHYAFQQLDTSDPMHMLALGIFIGYMLRS